MTRPDDHDQVSPQQRYTADAPCPICDGDARAPRGTGERCHGYVHQDGSGAFCSQRESGKQQERPRGPNGTITGRLCLPLRTL